MTSPPVHLHRIRFANHTQQKQSAPYSKASGTFIGKTRERPAIHKYHLTHKASNVDLTPFFVASTKNRHFMVYYTNQLRGREREPGIKTKMRVKLSAKMLIIAWTLMKKKEPFNPDYLNLE